MKARPDVPFVQSIDDASLPSRRGIDALRELTYSALRRSFTLGFLTYSLSWSAYNTLGCILRGTGVPFYANERAVEIPWAVRHLSRSSPQRILEVGQVMGPLLTRFASEAVSVDLQAVPGIATAGWTSVALDARTLPYDNRFDMVLSISTIEHIGMGHYGDSIDVLGDIRAIEAAHRALVPGGRLLLTVPYFTGARSVWQRLYTREQLDQLLRGFAEVFIELWHFRHWGWKRVAEGSNPSPSVVGQGRPEVLAVALVEAEKQG